MATKRARRFSSAVLLLSALPAYGGSFPVCVERAQYARIELVDAFAPTQCVVEAGNINPWLGLLTGAALVTGTFVYGACTMFVPGSDTSRIVFDTKVESDGANEALGHELRHAFEPREFHPAMLSMVTLPCE